MLDTSLSFGMQNWLFLKSDESAETYNYYGFQTKKGSTLIMRMNKTASEAKYFVASGVFDTIWEARAAKTYVYPSSLVNPDIK